MLEFVDKELFTSGRKSRTGDLLVKTRFRGERAGFLIHLEHQAQPDTNLPRRMLEYFTLDWIEYDLPVYPIAVLTGRAPLPSVFPLWRSPFQTRRSFTLISMWSTCAT